MSASSYAVLRGFALMVDLASLAAIACGISLSVELLEFIRQQDLTSRRAYFHIHMPLLHQLSRLLQGGRRCRTAKIDPARWVAHTDEVLQFRRAIHARRPLQWPKEEAAGQPPAARPSRSSEPETSTLLVFWRER